MDARRGWGRYRARLTIGFSFFSFFISIYQLHRGFIVISPYMGLMYFNQKKPSLRLFK
jgi:hypothetical protein